MKNVEIFDEIRLWNASKYANSQIVQQICCISPRTMLLEIRSARSEVWRQIYFEKPPKFWCFSMYSTTVGVPIVNSQCCIRSGASFSTNFLPKHSSKNIQTNRLTRWVRESIWFLQHHKVYDQEVWNLNRQVFSSHHSQMGVFLYFFFASVKQNCAHVPRWAWYGQPFL